MYWSYFFKLNKAQLPRNRLVQNQWALSAWQDMKAELISNAILSRRVIGGSKGGARGTRTPPSALTRRFSYFKLEIKSNYSQGRIQRSSQEGAPTLRGRQHVFVKFSQKLHEIEKNWTTMWIRLTLLLSWYCVRYYILPKLTNCHK